MGESVKPWEKWDTLYFAGGGGEACPARPSIKGSIKTKMLEWL
jgi:hypothetical protein